MAHELSIREDGTAEMAFTGDTPWTGLGQSVTKGASVGVWQKEAGMDWEALTATPTFHADIKGAKPGELTEVEESQVIYRSDTGAPLSIMGRGYQIVQPKDVIGFMREEVEAGGWYIHTAGVLRGGRKLWAMASTDDSMKYIKKSGPSSKLKRTMGGRDPIVNNLLIATSLDGSMRTTAALTAVRVVCANTLAMALAEGNEQIRISHRSIFDPLIIKRALGVAHESFEVFMEQAREMADTPVNVEEARELLSSIFKPVVKPQVDLSWLGNLQDLGKAQPAQEQQDGKSLARILALFEGEGMGADLDTAKGTRWGLFNAVTQHVDHEMGRTNDTRLDSAWFGRGNGFKQEAFKILVAA
jgi:phage/plasmid-like protein (TIGR03299 family)